MTQLQKNIHHHHHCYHPHHYHNHHHRHRHDQLGTRSEFDSAAENISTKPQNSLLHLHYYIPPAPPAPATTKTNSTCSFSHTVLHFYNLGSKYFYHLQKSLLHLHYYIPPAPPATPAPATTKSNSTCTCSSFSHTCMCTAP